MNAQQTVSSPFISIIIPLYNRELLIKETLESIINQEYKFWECIVVDDGSTDGSFEILQKYQEQDDRIIAIKRYKPTKGANVCRNIGLERALGKYVIFFEKT